MSKGGGQSPLGDFLMRPEVLPWNWQHAQQIASMPFTPYTGRLTPGVPTAVTDAQSGARNVIGYQPQTVTPTMPNYTGTTAATSDVYGIRGGGPGVNAMQGLQGLEGYMNPYSQQVIDASLADIDRSRQMATNQNASNAAMSNAFSNDRLGVENALTNEAYGRIAADTASGLHMGGFNTAAGMLMSDKDRLIQNQQYNAGFQQQANLANQSAANQFSLANQDAAMQAALANQGAGLQGASTNLAGAQTLGQLGGMQFGQEQMGLDQAYQEFLRQMNMPYMNQTMLNQALGSFGTMQGQWTPPSYPLGNAFANALPGMVYGGPLFTGDFSS